MTCIGGQKRVKCYNNVKMKQKQCDQTQDSFPNISNITEDKLNTYHMQLVHLSGLVYSI